MSVESHIRQRIRVKQTPKGWTASLTAMGTTRDEAILILRDWLNALVHEAWKEGYAACQQG